MKKILLTIAGHDPTSGAGISLDLRVFNLFNFEGMSIVTSITSQNTKAVKRVHCLAPQFLWDQYRTLLDDVYISGIKIGMIGCGKNAPLIQKILSNHQDIPKVVDPVIRSSSGAWLIERKSVPSYITEIGGKASLLTPNLEEARLLSGIKINNTENMNEAAKIIYDQAQMPCLIKGGHFENQKVDALYDGKKFHYFKKKYLEKKVHGTGCFLSSSLLVYLAKGNSLPKACSQAIRLTEKAIKGAIKIGKGQDLFSFSRLLDQERRQR